MRARRPNPQHRDRHLVCQLAVRRNVGSGIENSRGLWRVDTLSRDRYIAVFNDPAFCPSLRPRSVAGARPLTTLAFRRLSRCVAASVPPRRHRRRFGLCGSRARA